MLTSMFTIMKFLPVTSLLLVSDTYVWILKHVDEMLQRIIPQLDLFMNTVEGRDKL